MDCGAHIGVFSLLLAAQGVALPIQAFEPEPGNFEFLVKNVQSCPSIQPVPAAVGTADGERQLFRGADTGRWSFTQRAGREGVTVQVVDLYRHIRNIGSVALRKLDLEGYEAELLNRMPLDVMRRVYLMVLEEHHLPINWDRLQEAGFSLWYCPFNYSIHRVYKAGAGRA